MVPKYVIVDELLKNPGKEELWYPMGLQDLKGQESM